MHVHVQKTQGTTTTGNDAGRAGRGKTWEVWTGLGKYCLYPSKVEWDLTNGPLSKLLELLDTQV